MSKVDIKRLDSVTKNDTTATEQINDNFQALQAAIENTVSRDGTVPNYMDADLDLNSYRIINAGAPVEGKDVVTLEYFEEKAGGAIEAAAEAKASASKAASSAQSALVASNNAIGQLAQAESLLLSAETQLTDTVQYVDAAKADIDATVAAGKQEINTTIDDAQMSLSDTINQAVEDVKTEAVNAAQDAINDAAATATGIVVNYTNNDIKPQLNEIASNAAESAENASESAGLAANESGNAAISAADSQHYAEDSRIWAEGSDSEVKNVDGEHSSKVWSEMAKTSATSAANSAELSKQYANDKINQTHITNCITEIPQDIKLELNNGTLTLKAGSKVYVPNGSGKFDVIVATVDCVPQSAFSGTGQWMVFDNGGLKGETLRLSGKTVSSDTAPSDTSVCWYDTANNIIKIYQGGVWTGQRTLPLGMATFENGVCTSIDQVFNGFGYIGSTVFVLPGVKGLIPNGRNADGSLKNVEFATSKVLTYSRGSAFTNYDLILKGIDCVTSVVSYDGENNFNLTSAGAKSGYAMVGKVSATTGGVITSLQPKLPFRAADDQEVVKTNGNQTIDGVKVFTSSINLRDKEYDRLTNPSADRNLTLVWEDKSGYDLGYINQKILTDGTSTLTFNASTYKTDGTRVVGAISVTTKRDGTVYTYAPTPAASDNSTKIATTAWVTANAKPKITYW